ncbi:hypothetical protein RchiOBHm_Chr5g0054301 [Rosa chinensis]|uniref:Uncharacterized protein n=1 Tax=Rosa chinensis TaxID=74649 RepID=A0A2P6QG50_ROSCH|nr:hypothetical protein RchiOBHm_Chr5g0054301 [Rosa chinensis]
MSIFQLAPRDIYSCVRHCLLHPNFQAIFDCFQPSPISFCCLLRSGLMASSSRNGLSSASFFKM